MVDFDDIKRDLQKAADPRREGNPEPTPPRSSLSTIVTGQVQPGRRNVRPPVPVHPARRGSTMTGLPAPPAAESAPQPPKLTLRDLGPLEPVSEPPGAEPRSLSPPQFESAAVVEAARKAIERQGDRMVSPPESTPLPAPSKSTPPADKSLVRQLGLIAGTCTAIAGVITALGNVVIGIIEASRPPTVAALVERIEALELARSKDNGLQLEATARRAAIGEIEKRLAPVELKLKTLEPPAPAATIQGLPPTKP